ncbi:hypothetical protein ABHN09_02075 [Bacillus paramobilis]
MNDWEATIVDASIYTKEKHHFPSLGITWVTLRCTVSVRGRNSKG